MKRAGRGRPAGFDKVLELVGTTTLRDSLLCAAPNGVFCMSGIVGNQWSLDGFLPMDDIPTAVHLTTYSGDADDFMRTPLQRLLDDIAAARLPVQVGRVFGLDERWDWRPFAGSRAGVDAE